MEKYTQTIIAFNIWRFFLDDENKDVCNSILQYLHIADYYNFWASIFNWHSYEFVCEVCFKSNRYTSCSFCQTRICRGCSHSRMFSNSEFCTRCDDFQYALRGDESIPRKRLKFEMVPTGFHILCVDDTPRIRDRTQQKRGAKPPDNIE